MGGGLALGGMGSDLEPGRRLLALTPGTSALKELRMGRPAQ